MKTRLLIAIMTACTLFSCKNTASPKNAANTTEPTDTQTSATSEYPQDTIRAKDGSSIVLTFYTHASIAVQAGGQRIYIDPAGNIDWANEPKADLVLITHSHGDHFNADAIKSLNGTGDFKQMKPGESIDQTAGIHVDAVPAYNITEGHLNFHPKERGDAGYILTIGGTRIYVAGDTEDNEDVLALKDIDVAFLPVNQPYTMTVGQCARVIGSMRPAIFYPYHFGGSGAPTDLEALKAAVEGMTEMRIRPLE